MAKKLQILLATYNSEAYLAEQLDSILAQDFPDFEVLIRDGGSTDGTLPLVARYCEQNPGKIVFVGRERAGACENFSELLKRADGDLFMFADHDDVWMKDKISATLAEYEALERKYGPAEPILVFSDAVVADRRMNVLCDSLIAYQKLDPTRLTLNRLILQNVPSGNEMLFNRALAELALPIPAEAVMHDHWITLVAAKFGKIGFLARPTLYYRQHADNVFGAFRYSLVSFVRRLSCGRKKIRERFERNIVQAVALGRRYGNRLPARDRELCE
ncbi:MAG: glycosyltransferase family 2 protein, partial [Lentisphaeria bacterium]|nr:glycosyltransferase family 2 protein [Lentisphaeria bacterium]